MTSKLEQIRNGLNNSIEDQLAIDPASQRLGATLHIDRRTLRSC